MGKRLVNSIKSTTRRKFLRVTGVLVLLVLGSSKLFLPQVIAQTSRSSANATSPYAEAQTPIGLIPAFWLTYLSISQAQCSLNTGVCTMAIANLGTNSSTDLALLTPNACQMTVVSGKDNGVTTYATLNGTAGGQILEGIQAGSNVLARCSVPPAVLVYETNGSAASGGFLMKLTNNGTWPAGTIVSFPFSGAWTNSTINETSKLYQLEFVQDSNCPYASYHLPWGVVLDNSTTIVQPSNASLPLASDSQTSVSGSDSNYSAITFSVPNGTFSYTIIPKDPFNRIQSGNVTVDGSDVQVGVWEFVTAMGCSTTTTTSTTSNTTTTITASVGTIPSTDTVITTMLGPTTTTTSSSGLLYLVAAVAVIFIIATGYLVLARGKKGTTF